MNHVALTGCAATDASVQQMANGVPMASFIIAVSRGGGEDDFFRVRLYGRRAATAHQELRKGTRVAIEGELREDTYHKGGQECASVVVSARRVEYL